MRVYVCSLGPFPFVASEEDPTACGVRRGPVWRPKRTQLLVASEEDPCGVRRGPKPHTYIYIFLYCFDLVFVFFFGSVMDHGFILLLEGGSNVDRVFSEDPGA